MSKSVPTSPLPPQLETFVKRIRRRHGGKKFVPSLDPSNGNLKARYLLVLEAPGPQALTSGLISQHNSDPTAKNLKAQLNAAGVRSRDIAIWNVVPWFVRHSNGRTIRKVNNKEVTAGTAYLVELAAMMPRLRCIVLLGRAAAKAHIALSAQVGVRILACHHPSQRSLISRLAAEQENISVFQRMQI